MAIIIIFRRISFLESLLLLRGFSCNRLREQLKLRKNSLVDGGTVLGEAKTELSKIIKVIIGEQYICTSVTGKSIATSKIYRYTLAGIL